LGIAAAREKRRAAKAVLAEGKDPMLAKGQVTSEGADTFFAVANRWRENRKTALDPAHADRVWSRMERDVFRDIHKQITRSEIGRHLPPTLEIDQQRTAPHRIAFLVERGTKCPILKM
jgi:hypothetical protein